MAVRGLDRETVDLVLAARAGDQRAAEDLVARYLPLLYNIVGRALGGHADVDDVVQETVLRVFRDLPTLQSPASFRPWLVSIAMHQISGRLRFWQQEEDRTGALSDADEVPDPAADFVDVTILQLNLSGQRRQVAEAGEWLDPDDRELLSLWWMEIAGEIDRSDIVAALRVSAPHARVRIQRMRRQLELSRFVVAALQADPRCPGLDAVAGGWNGRPGPRWRKRFARHVRDCPVCAVVRPGFVPIERLLAGLSLVPVPASLASSVAGSALVGGGATGVVTGAGAAVGAGAAGWLGQLAGAKVAAAVIALATAAGGVVLAMPEPDAPPPVAAAPPATAVASPAERPVQPGRRAVPSTAAQPTARYSPVPPTPSSTGLLPLGPVELRPADNSGRSVALRDDKLALTPTASAGLADTTFTVVTGLVDATCYSLRFADGRHVRHSSFRLVLATDSDPLFRKDATFCARPGAGGQIRLESFNYRGRYVRYRGDDIWLDPDEGTDAFIAQTSFLVTPRR